MFMCPHAVLVAWCSAAWLQLAICLPLCLCYRETAVVQDIVLLLLVEHSNCSWCGKLMSPVFTR